MAKKLSSNSRKHKNAVVVCSIIGRKGAKAIYLPVCHSSDRIQDTEGNGLDFKSLSEFFLKNKPFCPGYEKSDVRKKKTIKISVIEYDTLKKDLKDDDKSLVEWGEPINETIYQYKYPLLGEYNHKRRKVILYMKNIEDYCSDNNKHIDVEKKWKVVCTTAIHEFFHAFFHSVTEKNKKSYNYIFQIEESMAELSTLVCSQEIQKKFDVFDFAIDTIRNKQNILPLAPYGFGAFLYENLDENERYELINNYVKKLGNIDENDDKVKEYKEKVWLSHFVPGNQEHCLELLKDILKPTAK